MCVWTTSPTCLFTRITFYPRPDSRIWQTLRRVQRQVFSHLRVRGLGSGFQHSLCISSPGRSHILALIVAFSCPANLGTVLDGNFPFCLVNLHLKQGLSRFKHYERVSCLIEPLLPGSQNGSQVLQNMPPCPPLACPRLRIGQLQ